MTNGDILKAAKHLTHGWGRYMAAFGDVPHGTEKQMAALLELSQPKKWVKPKIICMSGSSRFVDKMAVMAWEMEKQGVIVLGLHLLPAWYNGVKAHHQAEAEGVRERMDALHLRKIDMADELFVFNEGGYIGDSTRDEIKYAKEKGKPIRYLEE